MHQHHDKELSDARLIFAIVLNLLLTVVEVIGGLLSGSLSLLADAVHNFNDCGSLLIALIARRVSKRRADHRRTFGYRRAEVVGALINLTLLIVVSFYLIYEAVARFFHEQAIEGWTVIIVAAIALLVDLATVLLLLTMSRGSLNVRAAFLHNLSDALASVGVIIVGICALLWQFYLMDLIVTLVIAGYILWQSWGLLRRTISILMQSVPADMELHQVVAKMTAVPRVLDVHHLHVWLLDEHDCALEAHVVIEPTDLEAMETIKRELKNCLADEFQIWHSTLEFEINGHDHLEPHDTAIVPDH